MKDANNDNEEFSFISLAAATANALRYLGLNEEKNEDAKDDASSGQGNNEKSREHRQAVEKRLRELAAFERRANGFR